MINLFLFSSSKYQFQPPKPLELPTLAPLEPIPTMAPLVLPTLPPFELPKAPDTYVQVSEISG